MFTAAECNKTQFFHIHGVDTINGGGRRARCRKQQLNVTTESQTRLWTPTQPKPTHTRPQLANTNQHTHQHRINIATTFFYLLNNLAVFLWLFRTSFKPPDERICEKAEDMNVTMETQTRLWTQPKNIGRDMTSCECASNRRPDDRVAHSHLSGGRSIQLSFTWIASLVSIVNHQGTPQRFSASSLDCGVH